MDDGQFKKYDYFIIEGNSMLPIIRPNQKVQVYKTKKIKIGDIIVFNRAGKCTIHRFIKNKNNKIITRGDNCEISDSPLISEEIIGKVIKIDNKQIDNIYYNFINFLIAKLFSFNFSKNQRNKDKLRKIIKSYFLKILYRY
jgi:signal peptidase I